MKKRGTKRKQKPGKQRRWTHELRLGGGLGIRGEFEDPGSRGGRGGGGRQRRAGSAGGGRGRGEYTACGDRELRLCSHRL